MKSLCLVAMVVTFIAGCSTTANGPAPGTSKDDGYYVTGSLTKRKPSRSADTGANQPVDNQQASSGTPSPTTR